MIFLGWIVREYYLDIFEGWIECVIFEKDKYFRRMEELM